MYSQASEWSRELRVPGDMPLGNERKRHTNVQGQYLLPIRRINNHLPPRHRRPPPVRVFKQDAPNPPGGNRRNRIPSKFSGADSVMNFSMSESESEYSYTDDESDDETTYTYAEEDPATNINCMNTLFFPASKEVDNQDMGMIRCNRVGPSSAELELNITLPSHYTSHIDGSTGRDAGNYLNAYGRMCKVANLGTNYDPSQYDPTLVEETAVEIDPYKQFRERIAPQFYESIITELSGDEDDLSDEDIKPTIKYRDHSQNFGPTDIRRDGTHRKQYQKNVRQSSAVDSLMDTIPPSHIFISEGSAFEKTEKNHSYTQSSPSPINGDSIEIINGNFAEAHITKPGNLGSRFHSREDCIEDNKEFIEMRSGNDSEVNYSTEGSSENNLSNHPRERGGDPRVNLKFHGRNNLFASKGNEQVHALAQQTFSASTDAAVEAAPSMDESLKPSSRHSELSTERKKKTATNDTSIPFDIVEPGVVTSGERNDEFKHAAPEVASLVHESSASGRLSPSLEEPGRIEIRQRKKERWTTPPETTGSVSCTEFGGLDLQSTDEKTSSATSPTFGNFDAPHDEIMGFAKPKSLLSKPEGAEPLNQPYGDYSIPADEVRSQHAKRESGIKALQLNERSFSSRNTDSFISSTPSSNEETSMASRGTESSPLDERSSLLKHENIQSRIILEESSKINIQHPRLKSTRELRKERLRSFDQDRTKFDASTVLVAKNKMRLSERSLTREGLVESIGKAGVPNLKELEFHSCEDFSVPSTSILSPYHYQDR